MLPNRPEVHIEYERVSVHDAAHDTHTQYYTDPLGQHRVLAIHPIGYHFKMYVVVAEGITDWRLTGGDLWRKKRPCLRVTHETPQIR